MEASTKLIRMAGYMCLVWHVGNEVHEVSGPVPVQLTLVSEPGALRPAYRVDQPESAHLYARDEATHWAIFVNGELLLEDVVNGGRGARPAETVRIHFGPSVEASPWT